MSIQPNKSTVEQKKMSNNDKLSIVAFSLAGGIPGWGFAQDINVGIDKLKPETAQDVYLKSAEFIASPNRGDNIINKIIKSSFQHLKEKLPDPLNTQVEKEIAKVKLQRAFIGGSIGAIVFGVLQYLQIKSYLKDKQN